MVGMWCWHGRLGGLGSWKTAWELHWCLVLTDQSPWTNYFHFWSSLPSDNKRVRTAWKRVLPPISFEAGCTRDVLKRWTVAFLLPRDSFYMDGKLQMGPKAEMQIGRAVIRSIWQHRRLKSFVPTAAWSYFLSCADTAGCGLYCELCKWSFDLKTVGLGPLLLALWIWPSPGHPRAACEKPSEMYLLWLQLCREEQQWAQTAN